MQYSTVGKTLKKLTVNNTSYRSTLVLRVESEVKSHSLLDLFSTEILDMATALYCHQMYVQYNLAKVTLFICTLLVILHCIY